MQDGKLVHASHCNLGWRDGSNNIFPDPLPRPGGGTLATTEVLRDCWFRINACNAGRKAPPRSNNRVSVHNCKDHNHDPLENA